MKKFYILSVFILFFLPQIIMANINMEKSPTNLEEGIYVATLTPMRTDLSCDTIELLRHCLDLIERGCKGIVLFGTTGEGYSFSVEEKLETLEKIGDIDPKKIIMGNAGANITETVTLALGTLQHGSNTLLISPAPYCKNRSEESVISYYREIIQKINNPKLRVILYHIPQCSGVPITLNIIKNLYAEFPNTVIGIKESEGNLSFTKSIIDNFPGFKVFVGNERHIIEAVNYGASGSICGVANLYPELICSLYEQGKKDICKNPYQLESFFHALKDYPFIPAAKALLERKKGSIWHTVRPPLFPLEPHQSNDFLKHIESNT